VFRTTDWSDNDFFNRLVSSRKSAPLACALCVRALRAAPPVGEIPVVVLTSDKCFEFVPGAGGAKATCPAWRAAQDRLATLLNAKHITDTNSGHFIQGEQPQLVTAEIRQAVDTVRNQGLPSGH
jgi:pimeloyl-ACP methyl ester carboxylesterase